MLTLSNAFMKEKRIVANYGGNYVGMSDDVRNSAIFIQNLDGSK